METRTLNVFVNPGDGLRQVDVYQGMTVEELVETETLQTYSITIDGQPVTKEEWATTTLDDAGEVWAVGAVKGA